MPAGSGNRTARLPACASCAGSELYVLTRLVGTELIELRLCRRCHADSALVVAIDRLTEDALAE